MENEVMKDIEKAKQYQSVNEVQMVDGKITANFCCHEKENPMECCMEWISYKKVFDTWKEFGDYANEFFTTLNESE